VGKTETDRALASQALAESEKIRTDREQALEKALEREQPKALAPSAESAPPGDRDESGLQAFKLNKAQRERLEPHVTRVNEAREAVQSALRAEEAARVEFRNAASGTADERVSKNKLLSAAEATRKEREQRVVSATEELTQEIGRLTDRRAFVGRLAALAGLLALGELALVVFPDRALNVGQVIALVLISAATSLFAVVVFQATGRFAWFGVAAFLAIGIFQGFATHFSITADPKVEPAAVLLAGEPPVAGVFLTQTGDSIYVGVRTGPALDRPALVGLDRKRVRGFAVGPLTARADAAAAADDLARGLCEQVVPGLDKPASTPQC
jgi:hypothetical protein